MKNKLYKILLTLSIGYFGFTTFKSFHPTFYGTWFNNNRKEIGLKTIDENLERQRDKFAPIQMWKNNSSEFPRFYAKYISADSWTNGITQEIDTYGIMLDSTKAIIAIKYDFKEKEFQYQLKEFERPKNTYDYANHAGKIIRELKVEETTEILNKNGIKY
jgi:hypothetical protein